MSKISIIISQEYRNRVAKKSFIFLTFLMPLLMVAVITVPLWLASIDDEEKNIAVVDQTGLYRNLFKTLESDICTFDVIGSIDDNKENINKNNILKDYKAILIIDKDLAINPNAVEIFSHKQIPSEVCQYIESSLSTYVEHKKLEAYNIPDLEQKIKDADTKVKLSTFKLNENGAESNFNAEVATVVGMITTLLIYMFIFISGSQVMNAIVQEKSNRIVEVMVCSVKPWEMMWGKIIAVALVCLTQIALWVVMTFVLLNVATGMMNIDISAAQQTSSSIQQMQTDNMTSEIISSINSINWLYIGLMFIVYFIGGYLLYASLFAAIGASVDNESDTNQFMMPITIIVLFALYAGIYSAENPDGPLAFWCSIIPFTSPIVMMVRIPFDVPLWELCLSLGLLALTIIGTVWLSAKIYRVGILMYGKKPSIKEMIKWLKY